MQKILTVLLAVLLITACDTTQPPKAVVTRVEITPGTVLLTASGQSKTLSARAFDQNDKPMEASFSWASSKPEQVSIDSAGKVQANVAVGSSSITASAGGVKSDTVTAAIVALADGAVLVADAQVVSDFVLLDPTLPDAVGAKLKLTLTGVSNLVPGNLIVPSENKAFSGRLISSSELGGGKTEVTLERVSVATLFKKYSIDSIYDLDTPTTATFSGAPTAIPNSSARADDFEFKLGPFKCKPKGRYSLLNGEIIGKIEPHLHFHSVFEENEKTFSVTGTVTSKLTGRLVLGANFSGDITCKWKVGSKTIPVGGALAYLAGFQVPYGAKIQFKFSVQSPQVELALEAKNTITVTMGFSWTRAAGWKDLRTFDSQSSLKPRLNYPSSIKNVRFDGSLGFYGYTGLDLGSDVGDWIGVTSPFSILELNLGLRYDLKLASTQTQIDDSGYNSKYEVKAVLEAGLGSSAKELVDEAIKALSTDDFGNSEGSNLIQLKLGVSEEYALTRSPFGTDTVDKKDVNVNEKVKFNVKIDHDSAYFVLSLLPIPNIIYNIKSVDFYRVRDGKDAELIKSVPASDGQDNFDWEWTPTKADVGENKFYALVITNALFETWPLFEIKEESKMTVNVSGDSFLTVSIKGSRTENYSAPATGSETSNVDLTWQFDQTDKAPDISPPGIIFGQPVPGSGMYYLKPSLSGTMTHKGDYSVTEDCLCVFPAAKTTFGRTIDVKPTGFDLITKVSDVSVIASVQTDGSYELSVIFPDFRIPSSYAGSTFDDHACSDKQPANSNPSGSLDQLPYVAVKVTGKTDLSKDPTLQDTAMRQDSVNLDYHFGNWSVPVTVTVTWKLGFVTTKSGSGLKPATVIPSLLPALPALNPAQLRPWDGGINRSLQTKREPRC
jgi:hypothetical protein